MIRRPFRCLLFLTLLCGLAAPSFAQVPPRTAAGILADRPDLSQPEIRAEVVAEMRALQEEKKRVALDRATALGLPIRMHGPGIRVAELMAFDNARPLYAVTYNREAAISTAADTTRTAFGVNGADFTVGIWDGGAVRTTHEAFVGRVTVKDGAANDAHATHVGGTIAAAGPVTQARGMSPAVRLDSYDWNFDTSEMTSRGASYPGEAGTIYISNHSYGFITGWTRTGVTNPRWQWFGVGTNQNAYDDFFGMYNSYTQGMDALAHELPYYLPFWAAGNDRNDNPAQGDSVRIGSSTFSYNSAIHPPGDGIYKAGYDTISFNSLAKNVMTVGAVDDAVTSPGGARNLANATMPDFSSWGPTDDGRIKPDIVANGVFVFSTLSSSNTAYGNFSGTSMATPNASGSAQLLVSLFDQFFPGHVMRASTLKGLIVHTADNLGTAPGPNYQFGWGLMNTKAAADKIAAHATGSGARRILEAELTTGDSAHSYPFTWDGVSPIRATLCWTDPPGSPTTGHDNRDPRLVNNLDLRIEGPAATLHQPYVMPYVGNWTQAMLSAPATTGKNNTDNVEQVFIAAPPSAGVYTAIVTVDGSLENDSQFYSLIVSGGAPVSAPAPELTSISPGNAGTTLTIVELLGDGFHLGANVSFTLTGQPARTASNHEIVPGRINARVNTAGMAGGQWNVVVTNPDGQQATLPASFTVTPPLWAENFEGAVSGWSSSADPGSTSWALTEDSSNSPTHSFYAPGPATTTIDNLYSPIIDIPAEASDLSVGFWHSYHFASNDGGVIEFSLDGGNWFDPAASGSGASFFTGGYNGALSGGTGNPNIRNPLSSGSRAAWTGNKLGFSEVIVDLDSSIYAGKSLQIRWRLGTNNQTASIGWYIDDVSLRGDAPIPEPEITVAANATPSPVTGNTVDLNVEAENSDGSPGLVYTWTVDDSPEFPVDFSDNETLTANSTTATFSKAGAYFFEVTARNPFNLSASSGVGVVVNQTPTTVIVTPDTAIVAVGGELAFTAETIDQFDHALDEQPALTWTIDPAAGEVSSEGAFTAGAVAGGPFLLTAEIPGGIFGTAEITVRNLDITDWQALHFTPAELSDPDISGLTADADFDGVVNLLEYALGGNPRQADRSILPQITPESSDEGIQMVLTFSRPVGITDLLYLVESSADLIVWNPVLAEDWEIDTNGETETVTIRKPIAGNARLFLRLVVELE